MGSWVTGTCRRVLALLRRRPVIADVALVAVLLLPVLGFRVGDLPVTPEGRVATALLTLPLLLRRRWPLPVFAAIAGTAAVQWALDIRAFGDVALLVALYGVAVSQSPRAALAAGVVLECGVLLALVRWGEGEPLAPFVGLTGLTVAAAVMGTSTRNRRALVASLEERAERLEHERDQQGRLSAAAERSRIAREMHDIVAHNVSVMIALADGAGYALDDDPGRARVAMGSVSRTGRQALTEMRRLLGVLRDEDAAGDAAGDRTPQPGLARLDDLVAQVRAAGLPVAFEVVGAPAVPLPAGLQLAAYRIAQEALTNTLKHGGPGTTARLTVRHLPERLEVEVDDTGSADRRPPGVDGREVGAGLRGMRERAAVYDGSLDAGPRGAAGWRVRLVVPLNRAPVPA